jgi:Fe-S-cluster-containing hydrogenase component 2
MLCPRCQSVCTEGTLRNRVRRGDKVVWIQAACWVCTSCRTHCGPLQILTPELEDRNDALAAAVWRDTFDEDIPPPLPGVRIRKLMRTPEGKARVAEAFGKVLVQKVQEREGKKS